MAAENQKDPRFRPFRTVAWAVYLVVAVGFSLLVTVGVFNSVMRMTPELPPTTGDVLPAAECVAQARGLFEELDARRQALAREAAPARADVAWVGFRSDWLSRMRRLEARCAVDAKGREKLGAMFDRLERVLDLYTTATVQFAGGVGPAVEALQAAFADAAK